MHRSDAPDAPGDAGAVVPWLVELLRTASGLVRSFGPGAPLDPRAREQLLISVSEANGCPACAWLHGSWAAFLGEHDEDELSESIVAYALASSAARRPIDPGALVAVLPPGAIDVVRATVAHGQVANRAEQAAGGLWARVTGRAPTGVPLARDALALAVGAPFVLPLAAAAGAMRLVARAAPPMPAVEVPHEPEAGLLVEVLAEAVPQYLANAAVRAALLGLPFTVSVAVRAGRSAATVRVGRGRVSVANGIQADSWVVVEGDLDQLARAASGAIVRELGGVRIHPR